MRWPTRGSDACVQCSYATLTVLAVCSSCADLGLLARDLLLVDVIVGLLHNLRLLDAVLDESIVPLGGTAHLLARKEIRVAEFHATHDDWEERERREEEGKGARRKAERVCGYV